MFNTFSCQENKGVLYYMQIEYLAQVLQDKLLYNRILFSCKLLCRVMKPNNLVLSMLQTNFYCN